MIAVLPFLRELPLMPTTFITSILSFRNNSFDKLGFGFGIAISIMLEFWQETQFQSLIFFSRIGMVHQKITKNISSLSPIG